MEVSMQKLVVTIMSTNICATRDYTETNEVIVTV